MTSNEQDRIRTLVREAGGLDSGSAGPAVERVLLAELAAQRRSRRRIVYVPLAIAAGALLAFAVVRSRTPLPAPTALPVALVKAVEPETPKIQAPAVLVAPRPVRRRTPVVQRAQARPVQERIESEFIPVGPWQAVIPIERGSIVRVRLSSGSLQAFGIPVIAERWNESVPADLMLGEDGSVRAFRLVSSRNSYQ